MWLELLIQSPIWVKFLLATLCFAGLHLLPDPSFRSLNYIRKVYEPTVGVLGLLMGFFMLLIGLDIVRLFILTHSPLTN